MRDPEKSHVQKLIGSVGGRDEAPVHWRRALTIEREGTAQTFSLSVRARDGRSVDGFAMSHYVRHQWLDRNARTERLVLLFSVGAIYMEGEHLQRGLDALEEGKLKRIQVQDAGEIAAIRSRNADVRKPEDKEPIVTRVLIAPSLDSVLENDENLTEITKQLEEDHAHNAGHHKEPVG